MVEKPVISEFLNRPREAHSLGYGLMLTYLGLSHNLAVPGAGISLEKLSLSIGLLLIGVRPKFAKQACNEALPKRVNLPDDITKETVYFWLGITSIYAAKHIHSVII